MPPLLGAQARVSISGRVAILLTDSGVEPSRGAKGKERAMNCGAHHLATAIQGVAISIGVVVGLLAVLYMPEVALNLGESPSLILEFFGVGLGVLLGGGAFGLAARWTTNRLIPASKVTPTSYWPFLSTSEKWLMASLSVSLVAINAITLALNVWLRFLFVSVILWGILMFLEHNAKKRVL